MAFTRQPDNAKRWRVHGFGGTARMARSEGVAEVREDERRKTQDIRLAPEVREAGRGMVARSLPCARMREAARGGAQGLHALHVLHG